MVDSAIEANLFTIISNTHHSWHIHRVMCLPGVRGHAPPEKCQILRLKIVLSGAYKSPNSIGLILLEIIYQGEQYGYNVGVF